MTIQEALSNFPPTVSVLIEIQVWRHPERDTVSSPRYKVALLPGPTGSDCESFTGPTLADAVDKALIPFRTPPDAPTALTEANAAMEEMQPAA